jgi:hypothetical protein
MIFEKTRRQEFQASFGETGKIGVQSKLWKIPEQDKTRASSGLQDKTRASSGLQRQNSKARTL